MRIRENKFVYSVTLYILLFHSGASGGDIIPSYSHSPAHNEHIEWLYRVGVWPLGPPAGLLYRWLGDCAGVDMYGGTVERRTVQTQSTADSSHLLEQFT